MPIVRSARMTVVASVLERATFAVSAMRTTSPPMLTASFAPSVTRRRVRDGCVGGEASEDIQTEGRGNCTTVSCENHRHVTSRHSAAYGELEAARAFEERRFKGAISSMVAAEQK